MTKLRGNKCHVEKSVNSRKSSGINLKNAAKETGIRRRKDNRYYPIPGNNTVEIAVLSDSHVGQRIEHFPQDLLRELKRFDAIMHCGDYTSSSALTVLQEMFVFHGVAGNMDNSFIRNNLCESLTLKLEGVRIGMMHGWGTPDMLNRKVLDALRDKYPDFNLNLVLYGHSHKPSDEFIDGVRIINPGSVSGNVHSSHGSWGILSLSNGIIEWELRQIEVE